jgi:LysR family transcriptional activator of nhaA
LKTLNYHHLQYFWEVAKEGNLTRAAFRLGVAQSALSTQIKQLEHDLGGELFIREGKSLLLTQLGRVALDYADTIFTSGEELLAILKSGRSHHVQEVRVGCVSTLSRNFQLDFLKPLLMEPFLKWELHAGSLNELMDGLASHQLHLVLSNQPRVHWQGRDWTCTLVAQQPVSLVGKPSLMHESQKLNDLLTIKTLLLPSVKSEMRVQFDLFCLEKKWKFAPTLEIDDMAMMRLLTRDLDCVAVLPTIVVKDEIQNGVLQEYYKFPGLFENFYAITPKPKLIPKVIANYLDSIKKK